MNLFYMAETSRTSEPIHHWLVEERAKPGGIIRTRDVSCRAAGTLSYGVRYTDEGSEFFFDENSESEQLVRDMLVSREFYKMTRAVRNSRLEARERLTRLLTCHQIILGGTVVDLPKEVDETTGEIRLPRFAKGFALQTTATFPRVCPKDTGLPAIDFKPEQSVEKLSIK